MASTYIELAPAISATITSEVEVSNDIGNPVPVSAIDLDTRDLSFATDSVDVTGSEVSLDAATLAALENVTVSATDLDIRDLTFAADKVDTSGSVVALDAPTLAALENTTISIDTVSASAITSVAGSATSVQILASTAGRKMATFFNDSVATVYLKLGTTASTSSYTVLMRPYDYYELPSPVYTGQIDAIWDSATGNLRVTELS